MAQGDVTVNISKPTGKSLYFDGASKIDCGTNASLHLTDKISISCWYKMDVGGAADQKIINKGDNVDTEYDIVFENGQPEAVFRYTSGELKCVYAADHRDGTWHHYVMTGEANGYLRLYIDGVLRDTKTIVDSTIPNDATKSLWIGCRVGGFQYWQGKIDTVRLWNQVLSQTEISTLFSGGNIYPKSLVADYPFENTTTPAKDETGNGNDGTITGAIQAGGYDTTEDDIKTARATANDKWNFIPLSDGQQVMMVHIEEA